MRKIEANFVEVSGTAELAGTERKADDLIKEGRGSIRTAGLSEFVPA